MTANTYSPAAILREYLTGEDWENLTVIEVAGELYVTISKAHYAALGLAARALQNSLGAYGDYEIIDRTSMMTGDRELISVTYQVRSN
jgi:hypothetical protein